MKLIFFSSWIYLGVDLKIGVVGLRGFNFEGGIETYCNAVYPSISDRDHEFIFYTRSRYGILRVWNGMKVIPLSSIPCVGLETVSYGCLAFFRAMFIDRVDVIKLHAIGLGFLVPLAWLMGVRVVVRHVGADWRRPKWGPISRFAMQFSEKCAARFANFIICLNEDIARDVKKRMSVHAHIEVIVNPVPFERLPIMHESDQSNGNKYVLSVSRISQEKGVLNLIDGYRESDLWSQGIELLIVGKIEGRGTYKRDVKKAAASTPGCRLVGHLSRAEIIELYRKSIVFVSASTHEGMSFSAIEAMASGCRCLLSDLKENIIVGQDFASYFIPTDKSDLAKKLLLASKTPLSPQRKCEQIDFAFNKHDIKFCAKQTRRILDMAFYGSSRNFSSAYAEAACITENHNE